MLGAEMYTKFPTAQTFEVFIDTIAVHGCGFGTTDTGERVFINSRMANRLGLTEGMVVTCHVIPNYPDKQEQVPWRAIRGENVRKVVVQDDPEASLDQPSPAVFAAAEDGPPAEVAVLSDRILQHLREVGPTSTSSLTRHIKDLAGVGSIEISATCHALHRAGTIVRADVYRVKGQSKASMVVWAMSVEEMEVDQTFPA
jgi:hypothetical protein